LTNSDYNGKIKVHLKNSKKVEKTFEKALTMVEMRDIIARLTAKELAKDP